MPNTDSVFSYKFMFHTAVYCGAAPPVLNGFVENITSPSYQGELKYGCFQGFTLSGSNVVRCLYDATLKKGRWDATPSCQSMYKYTRQYNELPTWYSTLFCYIFFPYVFMSDIQNNV